MAIEESNVVNLAITLMLTLIEIISLGEFLPILLSNLPYAWRSHWDIILIINYFEEGWRRELKC